MKTIFSGIQPSGNLTLGNYVGALQHFVRQQEEGKAYYCIVNYHAITVPQDSAALRENTRNLTAFFLAAGLDPQKAVIFAQADVSAHTELGWILNCTAYMGELERMTQFKDKSEGRGSIPAGLFTYPTLMAADILLYNATHVPVGEDQKQHIEITRNLAERFNQRYGEVFVIPADDTPEIGARIMSLDDPTKKMSKSNPNQGSYISLLDSPEVMTKKLKRAVTDSDNCVRFDPVTKPAISNLISIYSLMTGKSVQEVEQHFANQGYGRFKNELAEAVVDHLRPIQEKYQEIVQSSLVEDVLREGAAKASIVANETLARAKKAIGVS